MYVEMLHDEEIKKLMNSSVGKTLIQLVILTHHDSDQLRCVLSIAVYPVLQIAACDVTYSGRIVGRRASCVCQLLAEEILCAVENCIASVPHKMVLLVRILRPGADALFCTVCK